MITKHDLSKQDISIYSLTDKSALHAHKLEFKVNQQTRVGLIVSQTKCIWSSLLENGEIAFSLL